MGTRTIVVKGWNSIFLLMTLILLAGWGGYQIGVSDRPEPLIYETIKEVEKLVKVEEVHLYPECALWGDATDSSPLEPTRIAEWRYLLGGFLEAVVVCGGDESVEYVEVEPGIERPSYMWRHKYHPLPEDEEEEPAEAKKGVPFLVGPSAPN